jgi:polysaccharide biosynthesis transport protein
MNTNDLDLRLDVSEKPFDLEQIWHLIRERAWLIVLFGIIGVIAGLAYIKRTPLTYYSQAVIQVDPEPVRVVNFEEVQRTQDLISEQMGQTLIAVFRSRTFAQRVIESEKLLSDPDFIQPRADGKPLTVDDGIGPLIGMSRVTIRTGTRFIDVGVEHRHPRVAQKVANALANGFIEHMIAQRATTSKLAVSYLVAEAEELKEKLRASEQALQNYVEGEQAISLQEKQDTVVTELKNQTEQLGAARAARMRLEADYEEIKKHGANAEVLLAIPSVATHPTIVEARQQVETHEATIAALTPRYTQKHPKMIQTRAQLVEAQRSLVENVRNMPAVIHSAYEAAVATEKKFAAALQAQEKIAMGLNKQAIQYNVLSRDVETDRALYESILKRLKEANIASGIEATNVHIFERAQVPVDPLQARKSKTLAIALAIGVLAGLGLSFGLHFLDSSIKTVDEAERIVGLPVLASVPRTTFNGNLKEEVLAALPPTIVKTLEKSFGFIVTAADDLSTTALCLLRDPGSMAAEAFRSLRTALYLAGREQDRQVVLFTSALSAEGKSFCSMNHATALAQQGMRTLLIDADLRSPMLDRVLLAGKAVPGLTEVLSGSLQISEVIHPTNVENLYVMPAGSIKPNPAELLASADLAGVFESLRKDFDRIVIDTAPITPVSDTLLLAEHVQAVCLVARAGKTPRKWILRAAKLLTNAGSEPVGLVINQVSSRMAGAYSYYPGKYGDPAVYGSGNASEPREEPAAA